MQGPFFLVLFSHEMATPARSRIQIYSVRCYSVIEPYQLPALVVSSPTTLCSSQAQTQRLQLLKLQHAVCIRHCLSGHASYQSRPCCPNPSLPLFFPFPPLSSSM